jgi:hypothetical protein
MYCPRCGTTQDDQLKFCKSCGANLHAVRQVIDKREVEEKSDLGKTRVAEIFRSSEDDEERKLEMERQSGVTAEIERLSEIKDGVIVASVGVGVSILLLMLMQGVTLGKLISPALAEILSRLWIVGIVPFLIGIALVINGLVIGKKIVELAKRSAEFKSGNEPLSLSSAETSELIPSQFSVTEGTTRHLQS